MRFLAFLGFLRGETAMVVYPRRRIKMGRTAGPESLGSYHEFTLVQPEMYLTIFWIRLQLSLRGGVHD
jgi:hypothetical protein